MTHLTFEEINDLADGRPRAERESLHIAECAECRETLRRVQGLLHAAQSLPRDVAPPPEVWTALQARVRASSTTRSSRRAPAGRYVAWLVAAAAVVFMAGGALLMSGRSQKMKGSRLPTTVAATPIALHAVERNYAGTVTELRRTLETQRGALSPGTIRVLERSLATIDTAIAEARAALASDPANQVLISILSANYERKVELLQRASELSPIS